MQFLTSLNLGVTTVAILLILQGVIVISAFHYAGKWRTKTQATEILWKINWLILAVSSVTYLVLKDTYSFNILAYGIPATSMLPLIFSKPSKKKLKSE